MPDMRQSHNGEGMEVRSKVWLERKGQLCLGAGKARILRAVEKTGSLSGAAAQLNMSYRHVWSSIRAAERRLDRPLLARTRGGRDRGGSVLTPFARDMAERFEQLAREVDAAADRAFARIFGGAGKRPQAAKRARRSRTGP